MSRKRPPNGANHTPLRGGASIAKCEERSSWQMEHNFWGPVTRGNPMSGKSFRVEFPAYGPDESVRFDEQIDALKFAREWAAEDKALVLVWDMGAGMYIQRYDGREKI